MFVSIRTFHLAKEGNQPEEYEDAFAVNTAASRLAVADGASDSYDSGRWARLLVEAFIREERMSWERVATTGYPLARPSPHGAGTMPALRPADLRESANNVSDVAPSADIADMHAWLAEPTRSWQAGLRYDALPWNQQAKARLGAHCTFLGVEINLEERPGMADGTPCGAWRAMAVGDTCLFQVRGGMLVAAFPLAAAVAFSTSPALLTTNPTYRGAGVEQLATAEGDLHRGDTLLLATDALAQWFLRRHEGDQRPWESLPADADFADFIAEQRAQRRLRNDDVTLLVAQVGTAAAPSLPTVSTAIVPKRLSDQWLRPW